MTLFFVYTLYVFFVLQCLKVNVKSYCTSVNFVASLGTVVFHYLLFPWLSRGLGRLIT